MHYIFEVIIEKETDKIVLNQCLKTATILLSVTPYHNMCPYLASALVSKVFKAILVVQSQEKSVDTSVFLSSINLLTMAIGQKQIVQEIREKHNLDL